MFYYLSKIFGYVLSPVFWLLLLMAWPLLTRKPGKMRFRMALGIIMAYLLMNPFLVDEAMRYWETPLTELPGEGKVLEAAVVLGGHIVSWDKTHQRYIFRQHTDRFLQAYALYAEGRVKRIILSAGPGHPIRNFEREAAYLAGYLSDVGVPGKDILIDTLSRNTHENALKTKEIMETEGLSGPVVLVTSAVHMRRASGCFSKVGIDYLPYSTDLLTGERRLDIEHLFVPSLDSLGKWRVLIHEMIGMLVYRIMGYV
ncbi:MAG: YdcF family protein [Bacteroidales bacterium]|nr:YdcF family protein [Bacteroidales bacterium]